MDRNGVLAWGFKHLMSTKIDRVPFTPRRHDEEALFVEASQTFTAPGSTAPIRICGDMVVQVSGTATSFKAMYERCPGDPVQTPNGYADADHEYFEGNLSEGIAARRYHDPLGAYFRVTVLEISGGDAVIQFRGQAA